MMPARRLRAMRLDATPAHLARSLLIRDGG